MNMFENIACENEWFSIINWLGLDYVTDMNSYPSSTESHFCFSVSLIMNKSLVFKIKYKFDVADWLNHDVSFQTIWIAGKEFSTRILRIKFREHI